MNRPSSGTMALGHPLVVWPGLLVTATLAWAAWQDAADWGLLVILAVLAMWPVVQANTRRMEYLNWRGAWDSMAEPVKRRMPDERPARWRPWVGGLMLAALGFFFAANADDPVYRLGVVWLGLGLPIAGVAAWVLRRGSRPKARKAVLVTVCVAGPLLPVPSLKQAYRALPNHSLILLGIAR